MMPEIPAEIHQNILLFTPAESLMRFRSVCKPWLAIIDSCDFVKKHLKHAHESSRFYKFVCHSPHSETVFSVDVDSLDHVHPLEPPCPTHNIFNSCNGLILFADRYESLVIWNPFTRKYRTLPQYPVGPMKRFGIDYPGSTYGVTHGFGYDSLNDDYKVLRVEFASIINDEQNFHSICAAKVYSLKSNTWKTTFLQTFNFGGYSQDWVHVNGALHNQSREGFIIAFDLATEEFRRIPQPESLDDVLADVFDLAIIALQSFLCLHCQKEEPYNIEIWIMKEYGFKESWTKLLSLAPPLIPDSCMRTAFPVIYSITYQKVLLNMCPLVNTDKFVWFDLKLNVFNDADVQGPESSRSKFCLDTMESPHRSPFIPAFLFQNSCLLD